MINEIINFDTPTRQINARVELFAEGSTPTTLSGSEIYIDNAATHSEPMEVKLSSDTITDFTNCGTVYGKNLFNVFLMHSPAVSADGSFNVSKRAQPTYNANWKTIPLRQLAPGLEVGKTYTLSANHTNTTGHYIYLGQGYNKSWNFGSSLTMTEQILDSKVSWYNSNDNNDTTVHTISNVQIEEGTKATAYEPYTETPLRASVARLVDGVEDLRAYANSDGTVEGMYQVSKPFTLVVDPTGIDMEITYLRSLSADNESLTNRDAVKEITIERLGESGKFFGFGVTHKATIKLVDKDRAINIEKGYCSKVSFDDLTVLPKFTVEDVKRDENTNELTVTAFDAIARTATMTVGELDLGSEQPSIADYARACALALGLPVSFGENTMFNLVGDFNIEGTETLRELLDDIAEATQTIYYISYDNELIFKRLDRDGNAVATIGKSQYFTLQSKEAKTLNALVSATELGDNVEFSLGDGETQYIRDNMFLALQKEIEDILINALGFVNGTTITPFTCKWRGNYLIEIGDKINFITKDDGSITTYLLNDKLVYNGGLSQESEWQYEASAETHTNPVTLGDALKQTYARVDKANKQIELLTSSVDANSNQLASLQINTDSINQTVQSVQEQQDNLTGEVATLTERVNLAITEDQLVIEVANQLEDGVSKVRTGKNFTFDDNGLTIEDVKEDTNKIITTTVSNNGMVVQVDKKEVLVANDEGVTAVDLHAKTYLVIGSNSRFEDYGRNRTACFWIGG